MKFVATGKSFFCPHKPDILTQQTDVFNNYRGSDKTHFIFNIR